MRTAKTADMINNMVKFRVSGSAFSFLSSTCSSSQPSGCLFIPNHSEQKRMSDPSQQRLFQSEKKVNEKNSAKQIKLFL